jgi:hypothetical protein
LCHGWRSFGGGGEQVSNINRSAWAADNIYLPG